MKSLPKSLLKSFLLLAVAAGAAAVAQTERTSVAGNPETGDRNEPQVLSIAEVRRGQHVEVRGEVVRVLDRDEFRLADATASIRVYVGWRNQAPVSVGDQVTVEGIVDDEMTFGLRRPEIYASRVTLSSGKTIHYESAADIRPKPAGSSTDQAVAAGSESRGADDHVQSDQRTSNITPISQLARGQSATIRGTVSRILDSDEFRIADETGSVRVYIGWRNRVAVNLGEVVMVSGVMDDDPWPLRPELYASSIVRADGSAIDLRTGRLGSPHEAPRGSASRDSTSSPGVDGTPETITPIAELRPYDVVAIRGVVDRITDEDEFRLRDDTGTIRVYVGWRNRVPAPRGETVTVVGIVDADGPGGISREVYAYELTRADGRTIDLQRPAATPAMPTSAEDPSARRAPSDSASPAPADVMRIADVRRGQPVVLAGVVDRIRDSDEFILRDESGTIEVYIGWRNRMPVRTGERVTVIGHADDDVFPGFRPDIYAERIILADGRVVRLERGGYDDY